jgi:hypothetical protein
MLDFNFVIDTETVNRRTFSTYIIIKRILAGQNTNEMSFMFHDIKLEVIQQFVEKTFKDHSIVYTDYNSEFQPYKLMYYRNSDPESLIEISNSYHSKNYIKITLTNIEHKYFKAIDKFRIKYKKAERYKGKVFCLTQGSFGLQEVELSNSYDQIEKGNYTEHQIEAFEHITSDLVNIKPCGRLVILDGAPGTGKSYFVKGLIAATEALFLIIPSSLIQSLDSPSLLAYFIELREKYESLPIVLIVEDADECLLPRDGMNMSAISTLLNLGDGLIGSALDVRVICTTNAKAMEIDRALVRPGRLCAQVSIGPLTPEKCAIIYMRLTGNNRSFDDNLTLSEVYALANDNKLEQSKPESNKHGFGFT